MNMKKYFLILAFAVVTVIALLYGISPAWFARSFLGMNDIGVNLAHIFRAVMCLYLALGVFWLYAAFNPAYRNTAVLTTAIFAGGLVIGRMVSFMADGEPSPILLLYAALELLLVPIAVWVFRRPN